MAFVDQFLSIVRKNWHLMLLIIALVLGAGYWLTSRQDPIFQARVNLKIVRSHSAPMGAEVGFSFAEDQVFYNTQDKLLRTQLGWAEQALDRAAWLILTRLEIDWASQPAAAGAAAAAALGDSLSPQKLAVLTAPAKAADFAPLKSVGADSDLRVALNVVRREVLQQRWRLNPDAFLASVEAEPVPSTYLAELAFESPDRGVAVFMVNLYAELYRDVSREERAETLEEELDLLSQQRDAIRGKWEAEDEKLSELRQAHPELYRGERVNLPGQLAASLSARVESLETERIVARGEDEHMREVLRGESLAVFDAEEDAIRIERADGEADLHSYLAGNLAVLALPVVARSGNVAQIRGRIQTLEQERLRLPADLTEESPRVKRLLALIEDENLRLGAQVAGALVQHFREDFRARRTIADLKSRLEEHRRDAHVLDELYARFEKLSAGVAALLSEKEALDRGYQSLSRLYSQGQQGSPSSRLTIQNIRIERRSRWQDAQQILPQTFAALLLTIVAAVLLAFGVAYLREFLDDTVKTKADFERLVNLPDIGYISRINGKDSAARDIAVLDQPKSAVAEAFRSVRTGILFSRRDEEMTAILLTSAGPGEGKTTIAVNLAVTMAQASQGRVLLVDADLRKPRVHAALSLDNAVGLTNCLVGGAEFQEVVQKTDVEHLDAIACGPVPPNPAELLGGKAMKRLLAWARESYSRIIFDAPPVVAVTDASILATLVDGVFLVISVGRTSWRLIHRAQETLEGVGVHPAGAILNSIRSKARGYEYKYGYE